jgi:hypothetical protein
MTRTAVYFGLWTAFCMLMSTVAMFTIIDLWLSPTSDGLRQMLSTVSNVAPFCVPAGAVAGIGWWLLHLQGAQPGWRRYGLFAFAVVLVNHLLIFGFWLVLLFPAGFVAMARELAVAFVLHGWISVPVALVGTYLFVAWNKRRLGVHKTQ